jgi:uncharacterized membrane protein
MDFLPFQTAFFIFFVHPEALFVWATSAVLAYLAIKLAKIVVQKIPFLKKHLSAIRVSQELIWMVCLSIFPVYLIGFYAYVHYAHWTEGQFARSSFKTFRNEQ